MAAKQIKVKVTVSGAEERTITLASSATVADALNAVGAPGASNVAINKVVVTGNKRLSNGDKLRVFPPAGKQGR